MSTDSSNRYGGNADDGCLPSSEPKAYFQGYGASHAYQNPKNPDGSVIYDDAYYLLDSQDFPWDSQTLADAYWCEANGYEMKDAPSPKAVAPVGNGG